MKASKKLCLLAMIALLGSAGAYAQKANVKSAERIAKSKNANFGEARSLIQEAMQNPETKEDAKTFYVGGLIEENTFTSENLKQLDGLDPDRAIMNKALLEMYDLYMQAYDIDHKPDAKGRVKPRHTKEILKSFETNLLYFINAGGYYIEQKQYDNALRAFKDFKEIKALPDFQGQPIAAADTNSMMVDFFTVVTAYQAGQKEVAVDLALKVKDVPYRQNDLYQILAQTQIEMGDTTAYMATMKEGLELFPNEPFYSVNLINTYISAGKTEDAIVTIQKAIERSPDNAQYYDVLGKLYENSNEEKAIESFKKAIEIDPEYGEAHYDLGRIYYNKAVTVKSGEKVDAATDAKAKELFNLALPYLEKAYEKDPKQAYYVLGNVYYNLGMNKEYEEIMAKNGGKK